VPHFEGGRSTGFRLFAIRQNSIFDKIGLKNGDVIQRVNGADLSDPARALALFQQLRNERDIAVEIVRNKETKTLSYQFQ
jgi:general secretion pathway protein C